MVLVPWEVLGQVRGLILGLNNREKKVVMKGGQIKHTGSDRVVEINVQGGFSTLGSIRTRGRLNSRPKYRCFRLNMREKKVVTNRVKSSIQGQAGRSKSMSLEVIVPWKPLGPVGRLILSLNRREVVVVMNGGQIKHKRSERKVEITVP